jgi:CHAT domain-containing protein/tetratricopeptide (TPR) repeat protein
MLPPRLRRPAQLTVILLVCLALRANSGDRATLVQQVERAFRGVQGPQHARLSIMAGVPDPDGARRPGHSAEFNEITRRITNRLNGGGDPDALHASGLVDLAFGDTTVAAADRVVNELVLAAEAEASAPILSDLAGGYLVRAQRRSSAMDLLLAVETAERSLRVDSGYAPAHYNLALALDELHLDDTARRAWQGVAARERGTPWGRRAAKRVQALTAASARRPGFAPGSRLADWATHEPEHARVLAMDTLLGEWGRAYLRRDTAAAHSRLAEAGAIGDALAGQGRDHTVADAVHAIGRAEVRPTSVRRLAQAHADYSRGQQLLEARDSLAIGAFAAARAQASASPALAEWARYSHSVALFYAGRAVAMQGFQQTARRADTLRYPALAARGYGSSGTPLLRAGSYDPARAAYLSAIRFAERAGERDYAGGMRSLDAEAMYALGFEDGAFDAMRDALATLRPYRRSRWLHNTLYVMAQAATVRGLNAASLLVQDEGVTVGAGREPATHAEALLARARARVAAGDPRGAAVDVSTSEPLVRGLAEGPQRAWLEHDLLLSKAGLRIGQDPARAAADLDPVVEYFASGQVIRLLPALARRAEARLNMGDVARAVEDLDAAAVLLDSLSDDVRSAAARASMLDAARGTFDRLAVLHARQGRPADALAALERGRASLGPRRGLGRMPRRALAAPTGHVALEYALVGDTLLSFVVAGPSVHLSARVVDRGDVLHAVAELRSGLEHMGTPRDVLRARLSYLYDLLVRPIGARIPAGVPLVVVADGEMAAIPFAALYDSRRARYLVQDHSIRFSSTVASAPPAPAGGTLAQARSVFVADPAFSEDEHPLLERLPLTGAAALRTATAYPRATVLSGPAAVPAAVARALPGAAFIEFAGHVVLDEQRPAQSYLVLAPQPGHVGRMTAVELEQLDLSQAELVVLSACQTQRAPSGRSGLAGLSGAVLAAGARGVIGSLWRVDDERTRALMQEFHSAYRPTGHGVHALRQAQLRLLSSPDPALSSPAAWAGFRFASS